MLDISVLRIGQKGGIVNEHVTAGGFREVGEVQVKGDVRMGDVHLQQIIKRQLRIIIFDASEKHIAGAQSDFPNALLLADRACSKERNEIFDLLPKFMPTANGKIVQTKT
jgi:hypothetical protein